MVTWSEALEFVGFGAIAGFLVFLTPLWAPRLVFLGLSPALKGPPAREMPTFSMSDALILLAWLAVGNALVVWQRDSTPYLSPMPLAVGVNLLVALMWFQCQQFMRDQGIMRQNSRLLMQLLYPMAALLIGEIAFLSTALLSLLSDFAQRVLNDRKLDTTCRLFIATAAGVVLSISAIAVTRRLFKKFVMGGQELALVQSNETRS